MFDWENPVHLGLAAAFIAVFVYGFIRHLFTKKEIAGKIERVESTGAGIEVDIGGANDATEIIDQGSRLTVVPVMSKFKFHHAVFFIGFACLLFYLAGAPAFSFAVIIAMSLFGFGVFYFSKAEIYEVEFDFAARKFTLTGVRSNRLNGVKTFKSIKGIEYKKNAFSDTVSWSLDMVLKDKPRIRLGSFYSEDPCLLAAKELAKRLNVEYQRVEDKPWEENA